MREEGTVSKKRQIAAEAKKLIAFMGKNGICAECPCCEEIFFLRDAGLFYLDAFTPEAKDIYKRSLLEQQQKRKEIREERNSISQRSEIGAKAVNIGSVLERIAPVLDGFHFDRSDCRSLFDPIDYIIFDGLTRKGNVERIVFVEIKTGDAQLISVQKEIRSLVNSKRVLYDTYQV